MQTSNEDQNIHVPDIMFCKFCEDQFGINRGVYNSIDSWFFNHGIDNIIKRRKNILNFLRVVCKSDRNNGLDTFKFGKGGLNIQLNHYFQTIFSSNPIRNEDCQGESTINLHISLKRRTVMKYREEI